MLTKMLKTNFGGTGWTHVYKLNAVMEISEESPYPNGLLRLMPRERQSAHCVLKSYHTTRREGVHCLNIVTWRVT